MGNCPCGRPLHYSSRDIEEMVTGMVSSLGENVVITTPAGSWWVPRHYIALHGVKADELPALAELYGFRKRTEDVS